MRFVLSMIQNKALFINARFCDTGVLFYPGNKFLCCIFFYIKFNDIRKQATLKIRLVDIQILVQV